MPPWGLIHRSAPPPALSRPTSPGTTDRPPVMNGRHFVSPSEEPKCRDAFTEKSISVADDAESTQQLVRCSTAGKFRIPSSPPTLSPPPSHSSPPPPALTATDRMPTLLTAAGPANP